MNFYTITESRDDQRLAAFARFVASTRPAAAPTSVLVITRPEHVAPDRQQWDALTQAHAKAVTAAREAGQALDLATAQQHKDESERIAAQIKDLNANSAKWLTDALLLTELPDATGFVVMPDSQWRQPWSTLSFLAAVPAIEKDGIAGTPFRLPLHRRVFVPLAAFDSAVVKTAPAPALYNSPNVQTLPIEEAPVLPELPEVNKPTTAPVHVDPALYTNPRQMAMLAAAGNETSKKLLVTYLGWDREGRARSVKQTSVHTGTSIQGVNMMLGRLRSALSKIDVDLNAEHAAAFKKEDVEEAS